MKKISVILMAALLAISSGAFAAQGKHHAKHKHAAKPAAAAKADAKPAEQAPAK